MKKKQTRRQSALAARQRKSRGLGHERRDEILAAAKELFIAEGYETVTTRKLAERAALSQTSLYVYFKSKEDILDALSRATFAQLAQGIRRVDAETTGFPELLRRLMKAYVAFGLEHPDEYQLTFMVSHASPKFSHRKDLTRPFEQQGIG